MSMGRIELEEQPGGYVSGTRARWLLQGRRANLTSAGKLHLLSVGGTHAKGHRQDRTQWSGYSSSGARNYSGTQWLAGFHMNGDAINHG